MSAAAPQRRWWELWALANHYPALHGLRVLGILSVVQIHLAYELAARGHISRNTWLWHASQRLWFGMDLFFFLSGLLIGGILLSTPDRPHGVWRFYLRRSFRIVPLYYVVLTVLALGAPPHLRENLWREYLYLTNYTDTTRVVMVWAWSLCVEEHFYVFVPLLMLLLRAIPGHRPRVAALTLLWASGALVRALVFVLVAKEAGRAAHFRLVYIPTHARYDVLVAGVLLAYLLHADGPRLLAWARTRRGGAAVAAGATLLFSALAVGPVGPALAIDAFAVLALGTVTGPAFLLLSLWLIARADGRVARALGSSGFRRLATLGYGVYLVHMPLVTAGGLGAFVILTRLAVPPVPAFAGATLFVFAVSVFVAYGLHLAVEKPALWVRDRVAPP